MSAESSRLWVAIARLMRPQGRRGELLADPLTNLDAVFASGRAVWIGSTEPAAATAPSRTIEDCWHPTGRNAGRVVVKLTGCDSISDAEALAGQQVFVPGEAMPALDEDTYYVRDLIGCALFDGELAVGTIVDLQFPTAADGSLLEEAPPLLGVALHGSAEDEPTLVPFARAWLDHVDLAARAVYMHLPVGLIDSDAAELLEAEDADAEDAAS